MHLPRTLFIVGSIALLLVTACTEVRASSRDLVAEDDSDLRVPRPADETRSLVEASLARRGLTVSNEREVAPGDRVTLYKGSRGAVVQVGGGVVNGMGTVAGRSTALGSVVYVRYREVPDGTDIYLLGKPILDNRIACSARDEDFGAGCDAPLVGLGSPASRQVEGQEEADVVRGLAIELRRAVPGITRAPPLPGRRSASPPPVLRCNLEGTEAWSRADPATKHRLLSECRARTEPAPAPVASPLK